MDLSIAIVSWNTMGLLDECLRSIFETTSGIEFEVIVVDNASSDGSAEMVKSKYSQVKLIENVENVGFARANNQAYAVSAGRHFLLLNPDTVVRGDTLKKLVGFLDNHDKAGAVGPLVLNDDGSLQYSWARFLTVWNEAVGRLDRRIKGLGRPPANADEARSLEPFRVDWVGGCCLMIKREAVQKIGLMDESLFMYCEETDWCLRLHRAGWEVWVEPSTEIVHYGAKSSEQRSQASRRQLIASKGIYFRKHHRRLNSAILVMTLTGKRILRRIARLCASPRVDRDDS